MLARAPAHPWGGPELIAQQVDQHLQDAVGVDCDRGQIGRCRHDQLYPLLGVLRREPDAAPLDQLGRRHNCRVQHKLLRLSARELLEVGDQALESPHLVVDEGPGFV
jgi:hypothetical protein